MTDDQGTARPPVGSRPEVPLPLGLWAVAALLVVGGISFLMAVAGVGPSFLAGGLIGIQDSPEGRTALAVGGSAMLVSAAGLVLRFRSAWGLTMLLVGIGLAVNLLAYGRGDPNYLRLAIFVLMAFYLNQRPVREVFVGLGARRLRR